MPVTSAEAKKASTPPLACSSSGSAVTAAVNIFMSLMVRRGVKVSSFMRLKKSFLASAAISWLPGASGSFSK